MIEQAFTVLATILVMMGIFSLRDMYQKLKRENEALKTENQKLKEASRKHLPYQTLEDLEHAKAAWVLLNEELTIKNAIVDNLGTYIDRARADKRS